jgi:hypothetical protein
MFENAKHRFQETRINEHLSWKWRQLSIGRPLLADSPAVRISNTCNHRSRAHDVTHRRYDSIVGRVEMAARSHNKQFISILNFMFTLRLLWKVRSSGW